MTSSQLTALLRPLLEERGLELEALDVVPMGKRRLVRITVDGDGPEGRGPLLDDIAAASQTMSAALDDAPFMGSSPFTLEVSSRGVSKPLTDPKHYRRNVGRLLKVWLADGDVEGRITASSDADVTLDVSGVPRVLAYPDIRKAVVQVEMRAIDVAEFDDESEEN